MFIIKGIDLNALRDFHNDVLVIYGGGVFVGRPKSVNVNVSSHGSKMIEYTILTNDMLALSTGQATSDVAISVLRKLLKKAVEHKDKESEELISGALTLLEL